MFKFFRQYNKWILAVGVTLLMIVFLVEGAISSLFREDPSSEVIGTIDGRKVRLRDQRAAGNSREIVQRVAPALLIFDELESPAHADEAGHDRHADNPALKWLLMLEEAERMGLTASEFEIDQLMQTIGLDTPERLAPVRKAGVSDASLRAALRDWLVIQNYRELIRGTIHLTLTERLGLLGVILRANDPQNANNYMAMQSARMAIDALRAGQPRLSEPLLDRFLQDQFAQVDIVAVRVPADRYVPQVEKVDDKALTDLFERYRDKLPGEGKPYGFGYRTPDRVKLEYLAIPYVRLAANAEVEEADVLSFYDANRDSFRPPATTQPTTQPREAPANPTPEAREEITAHLKRVKAMELGEKLIKEAQAVLAADAAGLEESPEGYKVLKPGATTTPLRAVAERLQQKFGVLPDVHRVDDRWLDAAALSNLGEIGGAFLPLSQQNAARFAEYALSAKELSPKPGALALRHLQVGLASQPLVGRDGSRFIFRLTAAEPARTPASLDEVREQVTRDARRLAAFELLMKDRETWETRLKSSTPEALAKELGTSVIDPPPFPRRERGPAGLGVPEIEGIGRDPAFVDRVFELAAAAPPATMPAAATQPATQPVGAVEAIPVDSQLSLYLVQVRDFERIRKSQVEQIIRRPEIGAWVNQALLAEVHDDPFSIERLSKRVGFVPAHGEVEEKAKPE